MQKEKELKQEGGEAFIKGIGEDISYKEKFFLSGIAEYRRFPLNVYGLGARTSEEIEELIDWQNKDDIMAWLDDL